MSTPPGTGTTRPPEAAVRAATNTGCSSARRASSLLANPMPSAPHALPVAICGRRMPEPSSRLSATAWPPGSSTTTVSGSRPSSLPLARVASMMVVAWSRVMAVTTASSDVQWARSGPASLHHRAWCRCSPGWPTKVVAGPSHTAVSLPSRRPTERTQRMRQLVVQSFVTLDGVMQAPGGPGEDDEGGFAYGGWSVNYWDDQMGEVMGAATSRPFAMVLGRRTFDIMSAYWPTAPEEAGGKVFNDATKYVASRSRPNLEAWSNSVQIEGDAADGLAALKQEDGPELQVHGSANLIQTLLGHNLVDQYRLWVFPVVIGTGKRLFGDGTTPSGLRLVDSRVSSTGVVMGTWEPAGEIPIGSFGPE